MENIKEISKLKDCELLEKFKLLVKEEKESTACVIAHLAEIDKRKLYAQEGYSSLFSYCVEKYHYSEESTYRRIQAARLSQRFPEIIELLEKGQINLTTITLISPHLTNENKTFILNQAQGKSKREVELFLVSLSPREEEIKDTIRKLPALKKENAESTFAGEGSLIKFEAKEEGDVLPMLNFQKRRVEKIKPLTPQRFKIEFSASQNLAQKIQRAKEILRHKYPQGRLEDIFEEALELLLEKKDPQRKIKRMETKTSHSDPRLDRGEESRSFARSLPSAKAGCAQDDNKTRYIPQFLQREVYKRDKGKCSYVSPDGKPCGERNFLELDHVKPWALGGDHTLQNLQILCRTHNQFRAEKTFGEIRSTGTTR